MDIQTALIIAGILFLLALTVKPLRKTMGLLIVIFGVISSFTGIGLLIGCPMIIVGGLFLFI